MKIHKNILNNISINQGFTIVELLVSLLILTTITSLVVSIVWITLKSTVKTNNMNVIRQNGNFAMLQMTKMLQFSQDFQGVGNAVNSLSFNCQVPGASLQNYRFVRFTGSDGEDTIFGCTNSPATISSISAALNTSKSLIDTGKFRVTGCRFTCTQVNTGLPYTIGIEFTIEKNNVVNIFDDPAELLFQNSVTLRNSGD